MMLKLDTAVVFVLVFTLPLLLLGVIRKLKARLQGRVGAPIMQPYFDAIKLLRKNEVVSDNSSTIFRYASLLICAISLGLAASVPWLGSTATIVHLDVFSLLYSLALIRFATLLMAMDTNSPFGGFGASREAYLSVLVEPAGMLCLSGLAVACKSLDLCQIFSFTNPSLQHHSSLWILAGCGLFLATLVEASRMPADDPGTHLELTMVHEAMILENSGSNLAAVEYASAVKLCILLGLSGQCFLHAFPPMWTVSHFAQMVAGIFAAILPVLILVLIESTAVKLRWTKLPEFIGYAVAFGLLCLLQSVGGI